ncbi:MAG: hypothetical protein ACR2L1_08975 [Pyrinomonadaceae bacterium]
MSPIAKLILIFAALCFLVFLVYILVVRAYYRGDKKKPPQKKINPKTDKKE